MLDGFSSSSSSALTIVTRSGLNFLGARCLNAIFADWRTHSLGNLQNQMLIHQMVCPQVRELPAARL